jgi:GT2 family glycosyltransferase
MLTEHNSKIRKIDISIITVNYNLADEIEKCLISLINVLNSQNQIGYEVIIVDNNSPDKKLPDVEKKFKKDNIQFYYLDKNIGFGKGNNFGFSKASGEYICFLNPDTLIKEEIFTRIIDLFNNDESVGIIGPKQQVRPPFFDFSAGFSPNIFFQFFHLFGIGVFFEGFITYLFTKLKKKEFFKVDWILGAAIFIKSSLFKKVNGFDKDYFLFSEEVDLCKRVSDLGYKIIYYPKLQIDHIGSISGKKDYSLFTIRIYSSKDIYLAKHYKSLEKFLLRSFLRVELFSQIIIWTILLPINKKKSVQKLVAFFYLIKHNLMYEHRD